MIPSKTMVHKSKDRLLIDYIFHYDLGGMFGNVRCIKNKKTPIQIFSAYFMNNFQSDNAYINLELKLMYDHTKL